MTDKGFSSPREEALEIAYQTRKNILVGNANTVSVLRACLVIANSLNKDDEVKWITQELSGYETTVPLPEYRIVMCARGSDIQPIWVKAKLVYPAHQFVQLVEKNKDMRSEEDDGKIVVVAAAKMQTLLENITDRCLFFLNKVINELQYGGAVEYLMEEIRRKTDEKLATLDTTITDESHSLFSNLTSTNPADWTKVGHSCRKILKLLADIVFPPSNEKYTAKDGKSFEVQEPNFINRLCAFLDQKCSGEERKLMVAETGYLESYLTQTVAYAQMVEHNPSIEKFHADLLAIHTYLVASEILRHI